MLIAVIHQLKLLKFFSLCGRKLITTSIIRGLFDKFVRVGCHDSETYQNALYIQTVTKINHKVYNMYHVNFDQ